MQRVPDTEAKGRVHTSTAAVVVLPEVATESSELRDADVQVDVYRASGAGGQHVNTTESAVRLTHVDAIKELPERAIAAPKQGDGDARAARAAGGA